MSLSPRATFLQAMLTAAELAASAEPRRAAPIHEIVAAIRAELDEHLDQLDDEPTMEPGRAAVLLKVKDDTIAKHCVRCQERGIRACVRRGGRWKPLVSWVMSEVARRAAG